MNRCHQKQTLTHHSHKNPILHLVLLQHMTPFRTSPTFHRVVTPPFTVFFLLPAFFCQLVSPLTFFPRRTFSVVLTGTTSRGVGWSVSRRVGRGVGRCVGRRVGRSVGWSVGWSGGRHVGRGVGRHVGWCVGRRPDSTCSREKPCLVLEVLHHGTSGAGYEVLPPM